MSNENQNPLIATEYTMIRMAVSELIEKMDGISGYYGSKKYCEINNISDPEKGVGIFDLQGAKYISEHIDGSFVAQYPFSVLLRSKCASDKKNLDMTDFMDQLGAHIEAGNINLDGGRKLLEITQTVATFENSRTDDNVLTLQSNFLLKYRKDD